MAQKTFSLTIATESGSYFHRVDFTPNDEGTEIAVRETMRDELMGSWNPNATGKPRVMHVDEARSYFHKLRTSGYQFGA